MRHVSLLGLLAGVVLIVVVLLVIRSLRQRGRARTPQGGGGWNPEPPRDPGARGPNQE
jgi:hypothetical protein